MSVTRRQALGMLGAGALSALARAYAAPRVERPNILWISCEDTGVHLGCYGDPHAKTPNLDRLAAQGVRYTRAFTVAGVCAPSRSAIISGMYPTTLGSHHMRCRALRPEGIKCFPEYLRAAGYYCTNCSKKDYNFANEGQPWDESSKKAHWRNRPRGKPFFAVFNITVTHEGRIRAGDSEFARLTARLTPEQRQDPNKLTTLPPYYPDTPVTRRDWARYYELVTAMDYPVGDYLRQLEEDGLAEETIVFFWADHGVGLPRAKRWLYDSGTHVPLIVRIPEKFRVAGQGEPGKANGELVSLVDLGPTVLNLCGVPVPEHMQGRAFLGPDLSPPRQYVYGARDRMDERYDIIRTVRDERFRYIRNYEPYKTYFQYMNTPEGGPTMMELRRLHAAGKLPPAAEQFMAQTKPEEELYDTQADPHEIHNLAGDPRYRAVLERLRAAHERWVFQTRDLGFMPEPEIEQRARKLGSAYAILRQPGGEELLRRLREVCVLAGKRDGALEELSAALGDGDPAVRYWAATGLGNMGEKARPARDKIAAALSDRSPVVRIAAARALCKMGLCEQALGVLSSELKSEEQWVRLHAALVLDEIDELARPAIPALKAALSDENKYVVRVANRALNELLGTNNKVR